MATDRSYVLTWYYSHGYPLADFRASWHQSDTPNHANIRYEVKEGDRQFVRDVITTGLEDDPGRISLTNASLSRPDSLIAVGAKRNSASILRHGCLRAG